MPARLVLDGVVLLQVATDKTGTLTLGHFRVNEKLTLGRLDPALVQLLAGSLESRSSHPLASAIVSVSAARATGWFKRES